MDKPKDNVLIEDTKRFKVQPLGVIVLPAFNESQAIGGVIDEIRAACDLEIIVVDDSSTDTTKEVASMHGVHVLSLPFQLGAWGAIQTGVRFAYRLGADYVVTMDADGQHEASYVQEIRKPLVNDVADVVIGSFIERGSRLRKIAWIMLRKLCKLNIGDITSGFRVYNRKAMKVLSSRSSTLLEFQDVGVLISLKREQLRIVETPVTMRDRADGPSRIFHSWGAVAYYMFYSTILGFSKLRHTKREQ